MFGPGDWPPGVRVDPRARRVGRPFRDGFNFGEPPWLVVPEVVWHEAQGTEKMARAISQCRAWAVRTAHIFYDMIPIHNPVYQGGAPPHAAYVAELVRTDLILSISADSGAQLAAYWAAQGVPKTPPIVAAPLPDGGFSKATPTASSAARTGPIALIGTVEPRKRQMQVLKAFAAARAKSPEAAKRKLLVIGSLHPYVANDFNAFLARNPRGSSSAGEKFDQSDYGRNEQRSLVHVLLTWRVLRRIMAQAGGGQMVEALKPRGSAPEL